MYDDEIDLTALEPGETNPLDLEEVYNPLNYAYPMLVDHTDAGPVEVVVKFHVTQAPERDNLDFMIDGVSYSVPFFEKYPETMLEPKQTPGEINTGGDYQHGEAKYYLIPVIVRGRKIPGGRDKWQPANIDGQWSHGVGDNQLTRTAVQFLVSPELLLAAIATYHEQVSNDPSAPHRLCELLDHFVPYGQRVSGATRSSVVEEDRDDWDDD